MPWQCKELDISDWTSDTKKSEAQGDTMINAHKPTQRVQKLKNRHMYEEISCF